MVRQTDILTSVVSWPGPILCLGRNKKQFVLALACFFMFPLVGSAAERILDFHSEIKVREDGTMRVSETIRVRAEGKNIRRGIYRDFPTSYKDAHGHTVNVKFDLLEVSRDGRAEPHHTESLSNGVRIYMGSKDRYLQPGDYSYRLIYVSDRQLGFFAEHDELYWNVTGTDWRFTIDEASATVSLPASIAAEQMKLAAFTGPRGAKGKAYQADIGSDGVARFSTTAPLRPGSGLTIVVMWPKGHIQEPTATQRISFLLADNLDVLIGLLGLFILVVYYWNVWNRVGRDPPGGVIYPRFEPSKGFSPASMRFVNRMGYDNKAFATALVNMAVNGYVTIDEHKHDYTLTLTKKAHTDMAPGENAIIKRLFGGSDKIELERKNHKRIRGAMQDHKASLSGDYERIYFQKNRTYVYIGIAVSAVLLLAMFLLRGTEQGPASLFIVVWLTGWSFAVGFLGLRVIRAFRAMKGVGSAIGAIAAVLFALPFFIGELVGFGVLFAQASLGAILVLVAVVATNIGFFHWMKAPTRAGRALLDEIEGFRMYLGIAEKERMLQMQGPERTPELFEKYLPYAVALDVEQPWAEQFNDVLAKAQLTDEGAYHPAWYRGSSWDSNRVSGFTSGLGASLANTVASASTAPGSSSGGGGGGFSGGGGGGGGGGGW